MAIANAALPDLRKLRRTWRWIIGCGVFLIALGALALLEPLPATAAAVLVLGWLMLMGGLVEIIQSFQLWQWDGFMPRLAGGLLGMVAGLLLITHVIAGVLACTLLLATFFIISGACRMAAAIRSRIIHTGWAVLEGTLTLLLGVTALAEWPASGTWFLGFFLGVAFLLRGWSFVLLALALRRIPGLSENKLHAA